MALAYPATSPPVVRIQERPLHTPSTCLFAICLTVGDTDGDYPGLPVVLPSKQDE